MKICGVDEAGRGPVIGPLVICAYCLEEKNLQNLHNLKIKESKQLNEKQRKKAFEKLKKLSTDFKYAVISAKEIDRNSENGINLNQLEAKKIAELLDELLPDVVYIDSPTSPDGNKFSMMVKENLLHKNINLFSGHYADIKYPIVAAASIIAKVIRDEEIEAIHKELGMNFGSGYPADPITIQFLKNNWDNPKVSEYIRKSWGTIKELEKRKIQRLLSDFEN
ncbi:MAG: ribonuclease HII [Candidatus Nanoarchaeia archaeon]